MLSNKKTILFGAPINFGFSNAIKTELRLLGYRVIDTSEIQHQPFKYKSLNQRLYNCYRKVVHGDYEYKAQLRAKAHEEYLLTLLDTIPNCDYGLFIRPDFFPKRFIEATKTKVKRLIGYQWDGLNRFPNIKEYIPIFDNFYVFDHTDLNKKTEPTTNFYFESAITDLPEENNEAYFIGSYLKQRMPNIIELKKILNQNGINDNILLFTNSNSEAAEILKNGMTCINNYLHYYENLKNTIASSVLIDIHNPVHNGLSFRIFESLGLNKKLITSNTEVKNYDFFNPNNIFIWNNHNTNEIKDFLKTPYQEVNPYLKKKYSFSNWVNYILKDEAHIPIELPESEQITLAS